jgi:Family of unknown function (DUF6496)
MAKYGKKASEKVERAMHERKRGTLKSGSGRTVKSRKQAIAIGLNEARSKGGKVPSRKSSGSRKSSASRKSSGSRKAAGTRKRTSSSRTSSTRSSSRKTSAKKR